LFSLFYHKYRFSGTQKLGPKALIVFLAGSLGVMVGDPVSLWVVKTIWPEVLAGDVWRGLATIAGSWIGGVPIRQH
jgi:uncharacterized membrane protein